MSTMAVMAFGFLVMAPITATFGFVGNLIWGTVMAVAWVVFKLIEHSDGRIDRERCKREYDRDMAATAAFQEKMRKHTEG